jgi:hypothetical protein
VANTLNLFRNGAVGFIDWLDVARCIGSSGLPHQHSIARKYDSETKVHENGLRGKQGQSRFLREQH